MVLKSKCDEKKSVLKLNFGLESSFLHFIYIPEWKVDERAYEFK